MRQINATGAIAKVIGEQFDLSAEACLIMSRQDQVEVTDQLVRRHRLQVQMQGIAALNSACLWKLLLWTHPVDFDHWSRINVLRKHIDLYGPRWLCTEANAHFLPSEQLVTFTQRQYAINVATELRTERTTIKLAVQTKTQLMALSLFIRLEPFKTDNGRDSLRFVVGEQGKSDHKRDNAQTGQPHRLPRDPPMPGHIQQRHRRQ